MRNYKQNKAKYDSYFCGHETVERVPHFKMIHDEFLVSLAILAWNIHALHSLFIFFTLLLYLLVSISLGILLFFLPSITTFVHFATHDRHTFAQSNCYISHHPTLLVFTMLSLSRTYHIARGLVVNLLGCRSYLFSEYVSSSRITCPKI